MDSTRFATLLTKTYLLWQHHWVWHFGCSVVNTVKYAYYCVMNGQVDMMAINIGIFTKKGTFMNKGLYK